MTQAPYEMLVQFLQDRDATVVEVVHYSPFGGESPDHATGSSKRNNGEPFDAGAGYDIALARALRGLAADLLAKHGYRIESEGR
jgi:uncharacterized protein DUF1876